MADFKLSAEIEMQAAQALREIDKVNKATQNTKREFNLLGRTITLDTKRISQGLALITATSGAMFAAIAIASPSMRAAFKQMELSALQMSIAIGEELAPVLEDTLVPAFDSLLYVILGLPPYMLEFIGLVIGLTVFLGLLAGALLAVSVAGLPLTLAIVGLAVSIAAIIVIVTRFDEIMGDLKSAWDDASDSLRILMIVLGLVTLPLTGPILIIAGAILIFKEFKDEISGVGSFLTTLGEGFVSFKGVIDKAIDSIFDKIDGVINKLGIFGDAIAIPLAIIEGAFVTAVDAIGLIPTIIGEVIIAIGQLLQGDIVGFAQALGNIFVDVFNVIISALNENFIDVLNAGIKLLDSALKIVGGGIGWRMPNIPELERTEFGEGGTLPRTGWFFGHKEEEVMRPVEARQFRQQRTSTSGGNTFIFNNTYKIGSVNSRSQMLALARESAAMQKNEMDRRFHA